LDTLNKPGTLNSGKREAEIQKSFQKFAPLTTHASSKMDDDTSKENKTHSNNNNNNGNSAATTPSSVRRVSLFLSSLCIALFISRLL
jgi:hypothetical protein